MRRLLWVVAALAASGETVQYRMLPSQVIGRRLAGARDTNVDRERTLHDLFTEAGCSDDALREQAVKGSKVPNLLVVIYLAYLDKVLDPADAQ